LKLMTPSLTVALAVSLVLALAGCKQHAATGGPGDAPAQVLPGSASDAMIAYDTLRSQPPLVAPTQDAAAHRVGNGPRQGEDAAEPAAEPSGATPPPAASATQASPAG
jgi:hypothetical protein